MLREKLLPLPGGAIVVALSGGMDSVCLLRLALDFQAREDFTLYCHHQQHRIRAAEAETDIHFCEALCRELGVKLFVSDDDVPRIAREEGSSLENTARNVRYRNWAQLISELEGAHSEVLLATAHHMDDQAETVLLHLERGTGLRGLSGMPYRRGSIIRPLLDLSQTELRQWAVSIGLEWREDSTNADINYRRNFLRHEIIPRWQTQADPGLVSRISRSARHLRAIDKWLDSLIPDKLTKLRRWPAEDWYDPHRAYYDTHRFNQAPEALKPLILIEAAEVAGLTKDLGEVHLASLLEPLSEPQGEKQVHLPHGFRFFVNPDLFWFERAQEAHSTLPITDSLSSYSPCNVLPGTWKCRLVPSSSGIPNEKLNQAVLRTYREGDYVHLKGRKILLKEWFRLFRFPLGYRQKVWLLAKEQEILMIGRLAMPIVSNYQSVNKSTKDSKTTERSRLVWYNSRIISKT